jgi:hypothetical protein
MPELEGAVRFQGLVGAEKGRSLLERHLYEFERLAKDRILSVQGC